MARSLRKAGYATSLDIGDIGRLLSDLEERLAQLAAFVAANAREASSSVPDRVSGTLVDISERFGKTFRHNARSIGQEATRVGTGVWHKLEDEVTHRPLLALAIAAGIGFLLGALNRR
jgi:ElaB/YqjD/DUF883 family membrane-anchored ribosome-binding protein